MLLKFKITCRCGCTYTISESICTDKVSCSNCGAVHPYSEKLLLMLKTAAEIQVEHNGFFDNSFDISVINPWDEILRPKESEIS